MTAYVAYSAGEGSWRAAKLWQRMHRDADVRLVFTDTLYEDADAYRFLLEGAAHLYGRQLDWIPAADDFPDYRVAADIPIEEYRGNPEWRAFLASLRAKAAVDLPELIWLVEGRDPWEVYRDRRFVGNSSVDPCSEVLKRKLLDAWMRNNCDSEADQFIFGIGFHEEHRFDDDEGHGIRPRLAEKGWRCFAPLIDAEQECQYWGITAGNLETMFGLRPARLYALGYIHNNCGGMCCKAGFAHWQNRRRVHPERYAYDAMMERKCRVYIGNPSGTFMADRRGGGGKRPLSLDQFAARLDRSPELNFEYEPGSSGCGCMVDGLAA